MKKKVLIVYGGQSTEHDISRISAATILINLDLQLYDPILLGITKNGIWHSLADFQEIDIFIKSSVSELPIIVEWPESYLFPDNNNVFLMQKAVHEKYKIDLVFPIIHGPNGEDGKLQALFELYNLKYAGCDMYASALNMDKCVFKDVLAKNNIPQTNYIWFNVFDYTNKNKRDKIIADIIKLSDIVFVKPSRQGSSIGISKVDLSDLKLVSLTNAIEKALQYDNKIIVEAYIAGREFEFAVLGNNQIDIAGPGEIISGNEFYDYADKYANDSHAKTDSNVKLDKDQYEIIINIVENVYRLTGCSGFARVDTFYSNSMFYINEINTLPGFTSISMFPMLFENKGIKLPELINKIFALALNR